MAPPMMMPAIGTKLGPFSGTAPLRKIAVNTGTTPEASETATHGQQRRAPIRLEDVKTATVNMKTANSVDQARRLRTAAMTSDTAASWTTDRAAAEAILPPTRSFPTHDANNAIMSNASRALASATPGCCGTAYGLTALCWLEVGRGPDWAALAGTGTCASPPTLNGETD